MFRFIRTIKNIMNSIETHYHGLVPVSAPLEELVSVPQPLEPLEPPLEPQLELEPVPDDFKYDYEAVVIHKWKTAATDDVAPLIAMIRQLYFFSECKKTTIRTYTTCKDDIPNYIGKIKRRPALHIDVSDVDVHDYPQMHGLYYRLRTMIGMFRINGFMVRVEHAFDNSQIKSEHLVVSKIAKITTKSDMVVGCGIDPVHHIVLPVQVHLKSICKIPANVRTLFHHISYSIQPVVLHSQTLDAWFNRAVVPPTNDQIMHLCIQTAEALAYLHASDIVHGDIKPGNTLITPSQSLYLIDFGMSGISGQSEGTGGTKPFCAPETGNGFNLSVQDNMYTWTKIQKHHDVWSFALTFFTLIVLRKPIFYPKDYPSDFLTAATSIPYILTGFWTNRRVTYFAARFARPKTA